MTFTDIFVSGMLAVMLAIILRWFMHERFAWNKAAEAREVAFRKLNDL